MASNKIESDDDDGLVLRPDYQAENYKAEEFAMENDSIERKQQQLNEMTEQEYKDLEDQLRIAETESLNSQTIVNLKISEQEADDVISDSDDSNFYFICELYSTTSRRPSLISNTYQTIGSVAYASVRSGKCSTQNANKRSDANDSQVQDAKTIISHSEDSDSYIEVNSFSNTRRRPSLISNTYQTIGSAAYASVRSVKCTQNGNKRSGAIVRQSQEAETIISHLEDSDSYIEVNSGDNTSRMPWIISDTYESVSSAGYARVRSGRYTQNANKRRCSRFRQVLFTVLAVCLSSTVLIVLSGSEESPITPIEPPCIHCNNTEVSEVNANKTCCDRDSPEMIRSHFISYVDDVFIHGLFEAGYNKSAKNIDGMEMKEWQGVLFRNRTFLTKAGPMRLKFFKEKFDDEANGRLFDFDETTGVFRVRYPGMYSVYANISSINVGRNSGKPNFVALHKRKTELMTAYYRIYGMYSNYSVHDSKIKNYMKEIIYLNAGDTVELQSVYEHMLIDIDYDRAYFGGSLVVEKDVE